MRKRKCKNPFCKGKVVPGNYCPKCLIFNNEVEEVEDNE